jgi:hypothetical protein
VRGKTVDHDGDVLDRSVVRTNLFMVFGDEDSDTKTIVPFEFELDVIHMFKQGVSSRLGHVQEIKGQRMGFEITMKDCILIGEKSS